MMLDPVASDGRDAASDGSDGRGGLDGLDADIQAAAFAAASQMRTETNENTIAAQLDTVTANNDTSVESVDTTNASAPVKVSQTPAEVPRAVTTLEFYTRNLPKETQP